MDPEALRANPRDLMAVILGGGAGTRLAPLTIPRSKPAVPLAGKYRLIDIPVSNCINSQVTSIFVLTQFNSASLNRHIHRTYRFDRFRRGFVTIIAAEQTPDSRDWFQGTADAVRKSMPHINAFPHEHTLILSGDQLYRLDYRKMYQHHISSGAEITIGTVPVHANDAPGFGILKTDDDGVITEFHEKPALDELDGKESKVSQELQDDGRIYLASMGIYLFNRSVLGSALDADPTCTDFGKEIIPREIGNRKVVSFPFADYWSDIGTIRSFYEANLALADREPEFDLYDAEMPIYTNARMLPPAKVQNTMLQDVMIAEAAVISDAYVERSVIGLRTSIRRGAVVKNSVVMGSDYFPWHPPASRYLNQAPDAPGIGEGSYIENAIIDKNVQIGKNCRITNDRGVESEEGDFYSIRDGIVVIPKNAKVPDHTVI
ncbi:MAG: glucose-1-phosphate adenylyltransferase [Bacteroidota bacterium]